MSTINIAADESYDPNEDCNTLRRAMADIGCNKTDLMGVICHRNQQQRSEIRHMYDQKFEENLLHRLKGKLHGSLETAVVLWMSDPAEKDARIIGSALRSWIKDLAAVTEVLYLRTSSEVMEICRKYYSAFSHSMEEDIGLRTNGDEKRLLLALVREGRPDGVLEADMSVAEEDAKDLLVAVSNRNAINKAVIMRILSTRSPLQMKATLEFYKEAYRHSFGKVIKQETKGIFQGLLRVAMKCAKNPVNYFAKALYTSMKGLGTDDATLLRIVVMRAEIDMKDIKAHFETKYGKSLQQMIISDTSRHYRKFLLFLIGAQLSEIQSAGSFSQLFSSRR